MTTAFDDLITRETSPETNGVTSVALLAVSKSGEKHIYKTEGRHSAISDVKVDENSAWWLYSITKTLTAISALQCVQRGEISLDDEEIVYALVPELKDFQLLSIGQDGSQNLLPVQGKITLRYLLTHTSGIGMDLFDPRLSRWRLERGETPRALCGRSLEAYTAPLVFEPGQGWAYGGSAEFAGIVVERLTGIKLGQYMKEHIFEPLGMDRSTFHPEKEPAVAANLVEMSSRISDGSLVPGINMFPAVTQDDSGAMGAVSTLADMTKLTVDLLQDEPTILAKESVEELCRSQFEPQSPPSFGLKFAELMFRNLTGEEYDPEKVGHGMGAFLIKKDTNVFPGGTLTMTGLPNLVWFINRERGLGGLYASAMLPPDDKRSGELVQAFINEAFARAE